MHSSTFVDQQQGDVFTLILAEQALLGIEIAIVTLSKFAPNFLPSCFPSGQRSPKAKLKLGLL